MVYKKFIRKNGKLYGPYLYHSKRVNGKVISEYKGIENQKKFYARKILPIAIGILFLFAFVFLFRQFTITGDVIEDSTKIEATELTWKSFSLSLIEGEFLPLDSQIIIESENKTYTTTFRELNKEKQINNKFYLKEEEISGEGEGFGLPGEIEINPEIYFEIELIDHKSIDGINDSIEENFQENSSLEKITNETPEENNKEVQNYSSDTPDEKLIKEKDLIENISTETFNSPITGAVVSELKTKTISGNVKKDNPFTYELQKNQEINLIEGSVKTTNRTLPDSTIKIEIENDLITISTNYSEKISGFGEEFVGNKKEIQIDISSLNMSNQEKIKEIEIIYQNKTLFSLYPEENPTFPENEIPPEGNASIEENQTFEIPSNITEEFNETELNQTEEENETLEINQTQLNQTNMSIIQNLTSDELKIIQEFFGFEPIITNSSTYRDKIIVKSSIGKYNVEYSYPNNLQEEYLEKLIASDQTLWLKDIAREINFQKSSENLIENTTKTIPLI